MTDGRGDLRVSGRPQPSASTRIVAVAWATAKVNRLPTILGYNLAYLLVGVGVAGGVAVDDLDLLAAYGLGVLLVKSQASIADAVHDRETDTENPSKSSVARSVAVLGRERALSLLVTELVVGLGLFGLVSTATGEPLYLAVGGALALAGFWYSYPPRLKEVGVVNHLVTTGADVVTGVVVVPVLLTGTVGRETLVVTTAVFLYAFGYHLVHQAADVYYDRHARVDTFARRVGTARTVGYAAVATGAAAGLCLALGYPGATAVTLGAALWYVSLYREVRREPLERQSELLADRFSVGAVATLLNAAMAVSVLLGLSDVSTVV
ncbi:prenyltransferase [Halobacteriales archaeon SW_7_71_33]|nr:MAG: prenyltransferase [Halobacteriales archaeon SW_7_71_33]